MTVYIFTEYRFPIDGMSTAERILCYAKGLLRNNSKCTVLTTSYNTLEKDGNYEGVDYKRINLNKNGKKNIFFKAIFKIINALAFIWYVIKNLKKGDHIIYYSNGLVLQFLLFLVCRYKSIKIIFELCEMPYIHNKVWRIISLRLIFPMYDGFIVISQELSKLALKYGSPKAKLIKIPILFDFKKTETKLNKDIQDNSKYQDYIFYAGVISEYKDGIVTSVKAFIEAQKRINKSIYYLIAGPESDDLTTIIKLAKENGLENNVIYLGKLKHHEVIEYLNNASLFILYKNDNIQNKNGFSTKLGEVLQSNTAVITTDVGEANNYLTDNSTAYIVPHQNLDELKNKIVEAFTNVEKRKSIAKNGLLVAQREFNCEFHGARLIEFLS